MLKKLLTLLADSLTYGISGFLGQLIGFLLLPLYTRELAPADYGVLAMLAFLPPVFTALASAGTKSAVYFQFYQSDDAARRRVVTSTAAASVFVSTMLVLGLTLTSAGSLAQLLMGDPSQAYLVRLTACQAALNTMSDVAIVALQVSRKPKIVGLLNVCQVFLGIAITIYLVVVLKWGVEGVVIGGLIGAGTALVMAYTAAAGHFGWRIDRHVWRRMAAYSLPFLPHRLQSAAMVFLGDYMIRRELGIDDVGLYNIATRFALPIGFLFGAFLNAWHPYKFKVFNEDENPKEFFRSIFTYYIFVLAYLWLGISLWGPEAVRLMTTPAFHPAAALVWAVAMMRAVQSVPPIVSTGIDLATDTRTVPLTSLAALVTVIIGCWYLVPAFGPFGAAYATTLAWLVMAVGFYLIGQRQVRVDYDWPIIAGLVALAAAMVTFGQWMQPLAPWLRVTLDVLLSLAYPVLCLLIMLRSASERERVEILLGKLFRGRRPTVLAEEPIQPLI